MNYDALSLWPMNKPKCKPVPNKPRVHKYVQAKRDGHCLCVGWNDSGAIKILTRTPTDLTEQLSFLPFTKCISLSRHNTTILGELWYPGKPASYIKTAIKEQDPALIFEMFAVLSWPAERELESVQAYAELLKIPMMPWWKWDSDAIPQVTKESLSSNDYEGYVLKSGNLDGWYKVKPVLTIDCVVTEIKPGFGKYRGMAGSLECGVYYKSPSGGEWIVPIASVSGMGDDVRAAIKISDIGRVCEVAYQYVGSQGRLRHPRFVQWRDDKNRHDCTTDQDDTLKEYYDEQ